MWERACTCTQTGIHTHARSYPHMWVQSSCMNINWMQWTTHQKGCATYYIYPASLCFLSDAQALTNTGRSASKPQPPARQGNPCSKPLPYDMCTSVHNHRQIPRKTPSCHPSQVCSGATPCCAVKHIQRLLGAADHTSEHCAVHSQIGLHPFSCILQHHLLAPATARLSLLDCSFADGKHLNTRATPDRFPDCLQGSWATQSAPCYGHFLQQLLLLSVQSRLHLLQHNDLGLELPVLQNQCWL